MNIVLGIGRSNEGKKRLQAVSAGASLAVVRDGRFLTITAGKGTDRPNPQFSTRTVEMVSVKAAKAYFANLAEQINMGANPNDLVLPS